ncbi:MAG TPA: dienelactone hydrolase [Ramlibacter sp.]|nr:dienelactone hydrolase [Ramlibacter sp.]
MKHYLITGLLALAAACAQAGVGLAEVNGVQGDGPVTVYYPTAVPDSAQRIGPFTLQLTRDAPAVRGNGRLVVMSHGSGGAPWSHADLARAMVEAGFVVAFPEHRGDNYKDASDRGPASWKRRPAEASRAIDAVAQNPRFAKLLSLDKVGMYGMSAGGHTALSLAGGRWSPARFRQHCEQHIAEDFPACMGLITRLNGGMLDGVKKTGALLAIRMLFSDEAWQVHHDPRIAAVVSGVPVAADFDPASLAAPRVPLGLVTMGKDKWLAPRFHSEAILAACKTCERVAALPEGGHGALLSPPPPLERMGEIAADLLGDPPGFDRAVLPEIDKRIVGFFSKHLLP